MAFNVNDMVSAINKTGVAKLSHFEVFINGFGDTDSERDLTYRADSVDIPGRSITSVEHKFQNYGPVNKVAYGAVYGDVTVQFLLSEDFREKEYFEIWQNKMVGTGAFNQNNSSSYNPNYFDNYSGTVEIRQYAPTGELRAIHTLNEAYPLVINPITMGWGEEGVARLGVTFAYRNYKCLFTKQAQPEKGFGFSVSIGPGGISGSARIPGIGNIAGSTELGSISANVGGKLGRVAAIRNLF
jgi:hypothetical protein|tara:strand:- start:1921 stop:2643 length:723 start_codon:yes stop_codon:yes gene_type:complete